MLKSDFLENYDIVYSGNDLIIEYELELRVDTNSRSTGNILLRRVLDVI
jgi:hypothetical protein